MIVHVLEMSSMIKDQARVFSFVVREEHAVAVHDLPLPRDSRIVCLYRNGKFTLPDENFVLQTEDEVLLITDRRNLPELDKEFGLPIGQDE